MYMCEEEGTNYKGKQKDGMYNVCNVCVCSAYSRSQAQKHPAGHPEADCAESGRGSGALGAALLLVLAA